MARPQNSESRREAASGQLGRNHAECAAGHLSESVLIAAPNFLAPVVEGRLKIQILVFPTIDGLSADAYCCGDIGVASAGQNFRERPLLLGGYVSGFVAHSHLSFFLDVRIAKGALAAHGVSIQP